MSLQYRLPQKRQEVEWYVCSGACGIGGSHSGGGGSSCGSLCRLGGGGDCAIVEADVGGVGVGICCCWLFFAISRSSNAFKSRGIAFFW